MFKPLIITATLLGIAATFAVISVISSITTVAIIKPGRIITSEAVIRPLIIASAMKTY